MSAVSPSCWSRWTSPRATATGSSRSRSSATRLPRACSVEVGLACACCRRRSGSIRRAWRARTPSPLGSRSPTARPSSMGGRPGGGGQGLPDQPFPAADRLRLVGGGCAARAQPAKPPLWTTLANCLPSCSAACWASTSAPQADGAAERPHRGPDMPPKSHTVITTPCITSTGSDKSIG